MKKLNLLAAITVACSALISGLQAAPITYSIVNNAAFQAKYPSGVGGYTLSGSITTDGTLGDVTSGILGWNWTVTDNATSAVVRSASGNGATNGFSVQASATQITLRPFGVGSGLSLIGVGETLAWFRRAGEDFGDFQMPASDEYYFQYGELLWYNSQDGNFIPLSSTADGSWIIADGGVSTVPEPSTYGLLFGGFTLAVVAMRRRTIKQA